jgi:hypothetical protein
MTFVVAAGDVVILPPRICNVCIYAYISTEATFCKLPFHVNVYDIPYGALVPATSTTNG